MENLSLRQLQINGELSERSIMVCSDAHLQYLNDILTFYVKNGTFLGIKYCWLTSNAELVRLCLKYFDNIDIIEICRDWDLGRLIESKKISNKTAKFCIKHELKDFSEILTCYFTNGSFFHLQGCTPDIDNILCRICFNSLKLSLKDLPYSSIDKQVDHPLEEKKFDIDIDLDNLAKHEILTTRARNVLEDNNLNSINKILVFFSKHRSFKSLRNVGLQTDSELKNLSIKYLDILSKENTHFDKIDIYKESSNRLTPPDLSNSDNSTGNDSRDKRYSMST